MMLVDNPLIKNWLLAFVWLCALCIATQAQTPARPPTLTPYEPNPRYLLTPGDVIEVQYRYTPEYNQTVTLQPDGFVSLEIVGEIKISGLNLAEVRKIIIQKASERLKDPEITLTLKEFQQPYIVVAGEVVQPGKFEMREKMTAMQAVMLAGGFKESARSSQIVVFRQINSEMAEVRVINLKEIKRTSDLENDLKLEAGDMLLVPRNRLAKLERFLKLANIGLYFNPLDVIRK